MTESRATPRNREATAVIVVHGVGDQKPFETVRRIGDLLQDLDPGSTLEESVKPVPPCGEGGNQRIPERPLYFPFREQPLRINVRPVEIGRDEPAQETGVRGRPAPEIHGPFYARVQNLHVDQTLTDEDIWWTFTRGQLECYRGDDPEDTYETIRLEGTRDGVAPKDVHLYELYWADLSRQRSGIFSIFMELYQLLFHLSSMGVHTVTAALGVNGGVGWKWRLRGQSAASWLLTVAIPILNLLMAGFAAAGLGLAGFSALSPTGQATVTLSVLLVAILIAAGVGLWFTTPPSGRIEQIRWYLWAPIVVLEAGVVGAAWRLKWEPSAVVSGIAESLILAAIAGALIWLLLRSYDKRRPGVLRWYGRIAILVPVLAAAAILFRKPAGETPLAVFAQLFETALTSLIVCWVGFILITVLLFWDCFGSSPQHRSRWSGVLLLALPAAVFTSVGCLVWGLIGEILSRYPGFAGAVYVELWTGSLQSISDGLSQILIRHGFAILGAVLAGGAVAAIPALWGMAPSASDEVFPPDAHKSVAPAGAVKLGTWLDCTFRGLKLSGILLWLGVTFGVAGIVSYLYFDAAPTALFATGGLSGAVFAILFAARGSLQKVALGLAPALDILLDVDNWLRELPADSNPKARIMGRYVSLLRYILNWKDADHPDGYDRIVIIAHSQGTVISTELLKVLGKAAAMAGGWARYDPQLARLAGAPLSLFTMGCPLRQLYNLRFPHLYGWAGTPSPAPLAGVAYWANTYRSGDYVGRCLWPASPAVSVPPPSCDYTPTIHLPPCPPAGSRTIEFCLGAGAHTHYWDKTAPLVAHYLDRMIS